MSAPQRSAMPALHTGYERLARFVSGPWGPARCAAFVALLSLPALAFGLSADDFDLQEAVQRDPFGAYGFQARDPALRLQALRAARATSDLPWWVDEHFHQAFFRPLASLSLALDFRLWPSAPWLMHLENILLFVAIVLMAGRLYRRLFGDDVEAGLATFLFATTPGLSITVGWISARNTLLAHGFGLLCLWAQQESRTRAKPYALQLGAYASFAAALLSAEGGVAALAYLAADFACLGPRPRSALRYAPYLLLLGVWRTYYVAAGYGVWSSTFYRDPGADPVAFALGLLTGTPIYLASQLSIPFASLSAVSGTAIVWLTLVSILLLWVLRPLYSPLLRTDRRARFLGLGALLATFPLAASLPQDRVAGFVAFGAAGLVAQLFAQRLSSRNFSLPRTGAHRLFRLRAYWAPLLFVPFLFVPRGLAVGGGATLLDAALPDAGPGVVLLNAPSHLPVHFVRMMRTLRTGRAPPALDLLYAGTDELQVARVGEHSLVLSVASGFLSAPVSGSIRNPARTPFRVGDEIELPRLRINVLAAHAGDPTCIRVDFSATPSSVWAFRGHAVEPFALPEVGASTTLARLSLL